MPLNLDLHRACTIALLGVVFGGVHSLTRPISLKPAAPEPLAAADLAPDAAPSAATGMTPLASPAVTAAATGKEGDITLAQARALYEQGVMFVDARSLAEFTAERVEGAVHLPLESLEGGSRPAALDVLDPGAKVVIYCGGGDCHASHDVAIRLNALGFRNCYVMTDGFPGWKAAGYEVTGGAP